MEIERQEMLSELDEYIVSCKNRIQSILSAFDWTEEGTLKASVEQGCVTRSTILLFPFFEGRT